MSDNTEVYVISVAANLAGMHAQTLRNYDRLGLVTPQRTSGGGRRYTKRDVALLREIQRLSQEDGVNLAGIKTIIELTEHIDELQEELAAKREENAQLRQRLERQRLETRPRGGELVHVPRSTALVTWEPSSARSRRRAR